MLLDDHGFVAPRLALANDGALMHPIPIIIRTAAADRHAGANGADAPANADFFSARWNGAANSHNRDSGHRKTLDHDVLLVLLNFEEAMPPATNRSLLSPPLS